MTGSLNSLWEELEEDRDRGSTELAHLVLSRLIRLLDDDAQIEGISRTSVANNLRERRDEMTLLVNLGFALSEGLEDLHGGGSGRALLEDLRSLRKRLDQSARRIAESFRSSSLPKNSPVIFSRSGTVLELLEEVSPAGAVTVLQSHPGDEGVSVANDLADRFDVRFRYDLGALDRFRESDLLLIGADSYDETGAIRNKVGTELLARASGNLPVVSCFQTLKYEPSDEFMSVPNLNPPAELSGELTEAHPLFERVPEDAIDYYVTDQGVFERAEELLSATETLRTTRERRGTSP